MSAKTLDFVAAATAGGTELRRYSVVFSNLVATIAPTVSDDDTQGYNIGSQWVDIVAGNQYICVSNSTGAAVWKRTTCCNDPDAILPVELLYSNRTVPAGNTITSTAATAFASHKVIPANKVKRVGDCLRITASGVYSTAGTNVIQQLLKVGSVTVLDSTAFSLTAGVVDKAWSLDCLMTVHDGSLSAAPTEVQGRWCLWSDAFTAAWINNPNTAEITLDWTADQDVTLVNDWGASGYSITLRELVIEYLPARTPTSPMLWDTMTAMLWDDSTPLLWEED